MSAKQTKKPVKKLAKTKHSHKTKSKPQSKLKTKPKLKLKEKPAPAPPPSVLPKVDAPRQLGSIESAKNEFLLQRTAAKKIQSVAPEIKKPSSFSDRPGFSPAQTVSRPIFVAPKPKFVPPPVKKKEIPPVFSPVVSAAPAPVVPAEPARIRKVQIQTPVTVKDLALKLFLGPSELIQKLIKLNLAGI